MQRRELQLLARALGRIELRLDGRLALTCVTRADIEETGADEPATDGVIDHLRAIEGVEVAAFIRETADGPALQGVAALARRRRRRLGIARERGGGGHTGAAGFSSDLTVEEIIDFIEREVGPRA